MATKANDSLVASLLPDDMVAGGLADDFDGIVREARYAPFDYNGSIDVDVFSVQLKIERLEDGLEGDEKFITQNWSAGDMKNFVPSIDGTTQVADQTIDDGEGNIRTRIGEGYYALRVGARSALNNNTNAAQLMRSMIDAQFPKEKFSPDIRFIEGLKGHWNRLPPDKKPGTFKNDTAEQKEKASKRDVLCLTRFDGIEAPTKTGAKSSGSTGTATTASTTAASGDIDSRLAEIVKGIVKPGAPTMKKTALSGAVLKAAKGDKQVNAMVKRVTVTEFLEGLAEHNILFDAEAGTVEAIAE